MDIGKEETKLKESILVGTFKGLSKENKEIVLGFLIQCCIINIGFKEVKTLFAEWRPEFKEREND